MEKYIISNFKKKNKPFLKKKQKKKVLSTWKLTLGYG
jgi:hypothetical protein